MYKSKKTGIVGIIVTIIILILIVIFSNIDNDSTSFLENFATKLVMPIQNGIVNLSNRISGNHEFFSDVNSLRAENDKLTQRNSELEQALRELERIRTENETLKEYLDLMERYGEFRAIPGYVINRDISNYSRTIVINIGRNEGVEPGMTVIADRGLVGHVMSVTDRTAKVRTIIDTSSSVSSMMSTTKDAFVSRGTLESNNELRATFIPTDANIIQGDSVETSGLGGIYPKGIHIGTVKSVVPTRNIVDRYAIIETAVDFNRLFTVLVITNN